MRLLFNIIFIAFGAKAVASYKLMIEPQDVQVKRGDDGQMACQFTESAPSCYWTKDGRVIDIQHRYQFVSDPLATGDCSIEINNASIELDDGHWQCGVPSTSNHSGVKSRIAIFDVLILPKEPVLYKDGELVENQGILIIEDPWNPPNILCKSEGGNPAPQLEFRVMNDQVPGSYQMVPDALSSNKTETATIQLMVNSTEGMPLSWDKKTLACVARHPYDNEAYHTTYASFQINATTVHLTAGPKDFKAKRGQSGLLRCDFSGSVPDCYWTKDNELIEIGNRYTYFGNPKTSGDCSLVINDSQPEIDSGLWRCGTQETSRHKGIMSGQALYVVLVEPQKPAITYNGKKMADGAEVFVERHQVSLKILCESATGIPEATLKWQLGNYTLNGTTTVHIISDNSSLTTRSAIMNLTQPLNGSWLGKSLYCMANHPAYDSEHSVSLQLLQHTSTVNVTGAIHVIPDQKKNPHSTKEHNDDSGLLCVNVTDVVHLRCQGDGHPPASHFMWERRDDPSGHWETFDRGQNISFPAKSGEFTCVAWNTQHGEFKVRSDIYVVVTIKSTESDSLSQTTSTIIVVVGIILIIAVVAGLFVRCRRRRNRARALERESEKERNSGNVYDREPKKSEPDEQTYEEICYLEPRSSNIINNHHSSADHVYQEIRDE